MLDKLLYYSHNFLVFIFVFSFFNDTFLVVILGENILKVIIVLFLFFSFSTILRNLKTMNLLVDKAFFLFICALTIVFLLQNILNMTDDILKPIFTLLSIIAIALYFSRYPIERVLYFVWISMVTSILICYFSDPITEYTFRKTGGTGDPNNFATQLLAFIFSAFYLYTRNKSKMFLIISLLLFTYGIFSAGSKSSFLIFAFILFFIFLFKMKHLITPKSAIILLILLIGVAPKIDFTKIEAIGNMLDRAKGTGSAEYRFISWKAGQHMVENNPILGVGMSQFEENNHQYAEVKISAVAPHNTYVKLIAESGMIVFILFLFFLYVLMIKYFHIIVNNPTFWIYLALFSIILMGMTLGLTYAKFQWLFIAIIMHIHHLLLKGELE